MKILEYAGLDTSGVGQQYNKIIGFLERDDFYSAGVKKFAEHNLYRAKLDAVIRLLGIRDAGDTANLEEKQSSLEEWQAEAHRLELQGRQEQADEIRRDILKTQPVPWDVLSPERVLELFARACDDREISQKPKKALFEYGLFYDDPALIEGLSLHGFDRAKQIAPKSKDSLSFNRPLYDRQRANLSAGCLREYAGKFYKDIIRQCELYGPDHRTVFNKTPLMLAASAGNTALVRELTAAGAGAELTDNYGLTAWQGALQRALQDNKFASELFPGVHELLAPSSVSLKVDDRLIKIDQRQGEFPLFHMFFTGFRQRLYRYLPFTAVELAKIMESLPGSVIPDYRRKRSYISALLSKNEIDGSNPYCKKLFKRRRTGHYILNPNICIRLKEEWIDIYRLAGVELMEKTASESTEYYASGFRYNISGEDIF